jgi:hypothetical protein
MWQLIVRLIDISLVLAASWYRGIALTVTNELTERVNCLFYYNLYSDSQIASKIIEEDGL